MSELDLRRKLLSVQPPDELEAERRSWNVVRAAWETREPLPAERRRGPILVAALLAAAAVVGAFALTPAGGAVGDWIKDTVIGRPDARPALDSLPASGNLLVSSAQGVWVVHPDGSKRRLGNYRQGSWSPRGLFVAATGGHQLVALEPDGDVRWTISRPQPVADARWLPKTGFRVAYRAGRELRVVGGDGKGDRLVVERVAPIAPAWRPVAEHVLAYGDDAGRIHVVETDRRTELWRTNRAAPVRGLEWSRDGKWLLAWSPNLIRVYGAGGRLASAIRVPKRDLLGSRGDFQAGDAIDCLRSLRDQDREEQRLRLQAKLDRALQRRRAVHEAHLVARPQVVARLLALRRPVGLSRDSGRRPPDRCRRRHHGGVRPRRRRRCLPAGRGLVLRGLTSRRGGGSSF